MRRKLSFWQGAILGVGWALAAGMPAGAQDDAGGPVAVLMQHNDNARTGANLRETTLNTVNVNVGQFGKLFTRDIDGYLYAQPLYLPNLRIAGRGLHNVVFLATSHDSVYCFDADDPKAADPLWKTSLGTPVPAVEIYDPAKTPWTDMVGDIGITSTPVVDPASSTIYVEAKTKENGSYVQRLHALDLVTGREKPNSPVVIRASVKGTGDGSVNGVVAFDPVKQLQRPALLLAGGVVYLGFGSHADSAPFHGWILGYDARTLKQTAVFNTAPNGSDGAIWQAGMGMASDAQGSLYAMVGNGTFDVNTGGPDYGDSILRLRPAGGTLTVADYFTPYNQAELDANDQDMGASGPLLIPDTSLLLGGGKNGWLYLVNRDHLGHYRTDLDSHAVQTFQITGHNIHGSPVYWNGPAGPTVYVWPEYDYLKAFHLAGGKLTQTPASQSATPAPDGMPGGFLSVSADGGAARSGIVWACTPYDEDANHQTVPGILRAYDAQDLSHELWNSKMNAGRDDIGMFAKFCAPTVADGKVFAPTFSDQLQVYGLLDGVLPAINGVSATSAHLVVHYKKPVEARTAVRTANYALDNGARVLRASLDPDGRTVYLATTRLRSGMQYTLTAQGVRDRADPNLALPPATHAWVRLPGVTTARR